MKTTKLLRHLFVPHVSNNYTSRIFHFQTLLLIAASLIGIQLLLRFGASYSGSVLGYASNISTSEVVSLTNQKRSEVGVGQLVYSSVLSEAARLKGENMLANNYWSHVGPDGTEPWDFFANVGYSYRYAGENLARDFSNPVSAVNAWMASPSHRENMLSDKYKEIGVAVVEGNLDGIDTTIIVQLFGTPTEAPAVVPTVAAAQEQSAGEEIIPSVNAQVPESSDSQPEYRQPPIDINTTPLVSPFSASKYIALFVVSILSIVLIIDVIEIERRGITRPAGRRFAHLSFLVTLTIILIIAKSGEIL